MEETEEDYYLACDAVWEAHEAAVAAREAGE